MSTFTQTLQLQSKLYSITCCCFSVHAHETKLRDRQCEFYGRIMHPFQLQNIKITAIQSLTNHVQLHLHTISGPLTMTIFNTPHDNIRIIFSIVIVILYLENPSSSCGGDLLTSGDASTDLCSHHNFFKDVKTTLTLSRILTCCRIHPCCN